LIDEHLATSMAAPVVSLGDASSASVVYKN